MRFGVNLPTSAGTSEYSTLLDCDYINWETQREYAVAVEDLGFDGIGVPDHLLTGDGATTECLTTISALARETSDVTLFPKTINNELRHPPLLAKAGAAIDTVSDGRFKLGMGAGWKADEAEAFGYEWPDAPTRLRKLEEAIELIELLWTRDDVVYEGDHYRVFGASCRPHPLQDPHPPIMVGGGGEEFTLRIVAKHADEWNYWGPVESIDHKLDVLKTHCETYGTDDDAIAKSWFTRAIVRKTEEEIEAILDAYPRYRDPAPDDPLASYNNLIGTPEQVAAQLEPYADLGIDEVICEFVDLPDTTGPTLFADEVIPEFA